MKVVKFLRQILRWIQSCFPNAARVIIFLRCNAFSTYLFRIFVQKNATGSCTESQIVARSFFKENKERINELASCFIDDHSRDVFFRIIEHRCNPDIAGLPKSDAKTQYFYNEHFTYGDDEVFVDCGAYTGDTVARFKKAMKHFGGSWKKIVAFEPDTGNYGDLKKLHKDVIAINTGVWVKSDSLCFSNIGTNATRILNSEIDKTECAPRIVEEIGGGVLFHYLCEQLMNTRSVKV